MITITMAVIAVTCIFRLESIYLINSNNELTEQLSSAEQRESEYQLIIQDLVRKHSQSENELEEREIAIREHESLLAAQYGDFKNSQFEVEIKEKKLAAFEKELETCQVLKFLYDDEPETSISVSKLSNDQIYTNSYFVASKLLPLSIIIDEKAYVSSFYGKRKVNHPKASTFHKAIDVAAKVGTPIYSPAGGFVTTIRPSNKGSGNFLTIQHAYGFSTSYSHLSSFNVKVGDFVKTGQMIARVGNTGISTGPHLHYEVLFRGKKLNPLPFYEFGHTKNFAKLRDDTNIPWDAIMENFDNISFGSALIFSEKSQNLAQASLVKNQ